MRRAPWHVIIILPHIKCQANRKHKNTGEYSRITAPSCGSGLFPSGRPDPPCGGFILTCEASFTLHILMASFPPPLPIQPLPQLQKIIHAKRRTTGGNSSECIDGKQVRDVGQKGL